jgi:hypothetical protein
MFQHIETAEHHLPEPKVSVPGLRAIAATLGFPALSKVLEGHSASKRRFISVNAPVAYSRGTLSHEHVGMGRVPEPILQALFNTFVSRSVFGRHGGRARIASGPRRSK